MSETLSKAEFIETDTTYGENKVLPYLFNATASDYSTLKWVIVARLRCDKENTEMYQKAFKMMFATWKQAHLDFSLGKTLKGIVLDWSDTERAGIEQAIGKDLAGQLLKGCQVHWARSYQRVAKRISNDSSIPLKDQSCLRAAFEQICHKLPFLQDPARVVAYFDILQEKFCEAENLSTLQQCSLNEAQIEAIQIYSNKLTATKAWVSWWCREAHLKMLCKALTVMDKDIWKKCPNTTNAVERQNLASKASQAISLNHAMTDIYCLDKAAVMEHIASEQGLNITYRDRSEEARRQEVLSKRQQRLKKMTHSDVAAAYGPPDKEQHFRGGSSKK